jgi:hypothetical protein
MEVLKQSQSGTSPPSANAVTPEPSKLVANLRGETSDKKRGKSLSLTKQPSSKIEKKEKQNEKLLTKIESKPSLGGEKSKSPLTPQPSSSKSEVNFPLGMCAFFFFVSMLVSFFFV